MEEKLEKMIARMFRGVSEGKGTWLMTKKTFRNVAGREADARIMEFERSRVRIVDWHNDEED